MRVPKKVTNSSIFDFDKKKKIPLKSSDLAKAIPRREHPKPGHGIYRRFIFIPRVFNISK
jgi:hypothetical protein